jgi:bifunctional N-acetylglucosamine-1-phosphate-uridyltransferase/glucosamine-1-phosphate-acetyltransferase GlmU-like protein
MSCTRIGSKTNERIVKKKDADERRRRQKEIAAGKMFGEDTTVENNL